MNSLNLVLEVTCKCGKGNVVLDNTYFDTSIMTCTVCDNKQTVNCYYVDELLEQHEYNSTISKDVKVLNNNGDWIKNHQRQFIEKSELDIMLKGYSVICEVNGYEDTIYYRKGLEFIMVNNNPIHETYSAYKFVAKEQCINNLIQYFLNN